MSTKKEEFRTVKIRVQIGNLVILSVPRYCVLISSVVHFPHDNKCAHHVVVYNSLTLENCAKLLYDVKYKGSNDIYVSEKYVVYLNDVPYTGLIPVNIYHHVYSIGIERVGEGGTTEVTRLPTTEGAERTGWYTLGGIRLSDKPTASGVYIHDGKKVVVR